MSFRPAQVRRSQGVQTWSQRLRIHGHPVNAGGRGKTVLEPRQPETPPQIVEPLDLVRCEWSC